MGNHPLVKKTLKLEYTTGSRIGANGKCGPLANPVILIWPSPQNSLSYMRPVRASQNNFENSLTNELGLNMCALRMGDRRTILIGLSAGLLLAMTMLGVWLWRGRPERHLARAEGLLSRGDLDEIEGWLKLPESVARTKDRAHLIRARTALSRGRPSEAVQPLNEIDPNGPLAADAAFWKGRTLYEAGQTLRALAWFQQAGTLRHDDAEILRWGAAAAYDLGARSAAVAALQEVTRLQRDDARAWRTLALIHHENAEHEPALNAYEMTLWLDGNQPLARFELAETLLKWAVTTRRSGNSPSVRGPCPRANGARSWLVVGKGGEIERVTPRSSSPAWHGFPNTPGS